MRSRNLDSIRDVLQHKLCIGCGVCVVRQPQLTMELNRNGFYVPCGDSKLNSNQLRALGQICPFSNLSCHEEEMGRKFYSEKSASWDEVIGFYDSLYAGAVADQDVRLKSSSGGMATWFLKRLLETGEVDHVIGVGETCDGTGSNHYVYKVVSDGRGVEELRKTKYYPVEASHVLNYVRSHGGKYAIIGVPCFIKAIRLLIEQDSVLRSRIQCCVAIICGHLKSRFYYDMILRQLGTDPQRVKSFDFRKKFPGNDAHDYGVEVLSAEGTTSSKARALFGTNWGHCFLKYKACDFCDDVFGELGDVVFGDAWVPEYDEDWKGNNVVITRDAKWSSYFNESIANGALAAEKVSSELIRRSQAGSIRHKRDSMAFRLRWLLLLEGVKLTKRGSRVRLGKMDMIKTLQRIDLRHRSVALYTRVADGKISYAQFVRKMNLHLFFWGQTERICRKIAWAVNKLKRLMH